MLLSPARPGLLALRLDWRAGGRAPSARTRDRQAAFLRTATYGYPFHRDHPLAWTTSADVAAGVLVDADDLPVLVRELEGVDRSVQVRWGLGLAQGTTRADVTRAVAYAEAALLQAAARQLPLAAAGDEAALALLVGGVGAALARHRRALTKRRWRIAELLRGDPASGVPPLSQGAVARELRVSKQYVSQELRRMGWVAYQDTEAAWRIALRVAGVVRD